MKKNTILSLLALVLLAGFLSCGDNEIEDVYIPIKSMVATTSTSLKERTNWEFYVNKNMYKSTVNGRTIHAQPKSMEEVTYFIVHTEGGKVSVTSNFSNKTNILIDFISPNYHLANKIRSASWYEIGVETPEMLDQSTAAKMINADALSVYHKTIVTSHINNVKLEHSHCLIAYTVEGLPQGTVPILLTAPSIKIHPLVEDGVYKAILVNPHLASLQVKVGEQVYEVSLDAYIKKFPLEMRAVRDIYYNFVLKYDAEAVEGDDVLTIEDMTAQKWSGDELAALEK